MTLTNPKRCRSASGMTQTPLAERVSVTPGMISYLESVDRLLGFSLACWLALALSVSLDGLIYEPVKDNHAA